MTDELRDRLQAMNPEPVGDPSPDELATVFAVIEARRSTMTVDNARDTTDTAVPRGRWRRPVAVFAGMAVVIVLAVGAPVLLLGGTDAPTADTATTTTPPTTTETAPPTTAATQPATPTTIGEIAVPPPPPDPTTEGPVSVERVAADCFALSDHLIGSVRIRAVVHRDCRAGASELDGNTASNSK